MASRKTAAHAGDEQAISRSLLRLWGLTLRHSLESFPDCAIAVLRDAIRSDGALWGYASVAGTVLKVHSVHLSGVPAGAMADYEQVKELDPVVRRAVSAPGRSSGFDTDRSSRGVDPRWVEFNRRWGLHSVSTVMLVQPHARLAMFSSFYRNRTTGAFLPRERRIHEILAPHLQAAYEAVLLRALERSPAHRDTEVAGAAVDSQGRLHMAEKGFEALLHEEWPAWTGSSLPEPITRLAHLGGSHAGARIVVASGDGGGGLRSLWARRRTPADDLSRREAEVAALWAQGLSCKEIATQVGLATSTVRNRIRDVYARLEVQDRSGVQQALRRTGRGVGTLPSEPGSPAPASS